MIAKYRSNPSDAPDNTETDILTDIKGRIVLSPDSAIGEVTLSGEVEVTNDSGNPVPVSGTVTATPPANASTNITQFGGNAVATGTGASGTGVPRVTVSSDSTPQSSTATLTDVASSASSVQILASTAGRRMAIFFNDSTQILYLKFGTTASTSSYTAQIGPKGYYELPLPVYTGRIDGIWTSANGNLRVTEL
jgi:hypothetical protein